MRLKTCFPVKNKKNRNFLPKTLDDGGKLFYNWPHPRKGGTEAREATGKIEGIGDVLSDGSKKHSWKVNQYERD